MIVLAHKTLVWCLVVGAVGSLLVPLSGCSGRYEVNEVLRGLVEERGLDTGETSVTIRVSNQTTGLSEKLTLRIDGLEEVFECPSTEVVCDYALSEIPDLIEAISEERFNEDGAFSGGRVLEDTPGFTLDRSDYGPGNIIVFLLGAESAEARVL